MTSTLSAAVTACCLALVAPAFAAGVSAQGTWESTLSARDLDGDGTVDAFYDKTLNISWLADGNAGAGSIWDTARWDWGTTTDGRMNWANANAWASSLDVKGVGGWRLPTMLDTAGVGCETDLMPGADCGFNPQTISPDGLTVYSEMAHLYYVTLGNLSLCYPGDQSCSQWQDGWGLTNSAGFRNLQGGLYHLKLLKEPLPPADDAWYFELSTGYQGYSEHGQIGENFALAVHDGDIAGAVPEPSTVALMIAGLLAVACCRRR